MQTFVPEPCIQAGTCESACLWTVVAPQNCAMNYTAS